MGDADESIDDDPQFTQPSRASHGKRTGLRNDDPFASQNSFRGSDNFFDGGPFGMGGMGGMFGARGSGASYDGRGSINLSAMKGPARGRISIEDSAKSSGGSAKAKTGREKTLEKKKEPVKTAQQLEQEKKEKARSDAASRMQNLDLSSSESMSMGPGAAPASDVPSIVPS